MNGATINPEPNISATWVWFPITTTTTTDHPPRPRKRRRSGREILLPPDPNPRRGKSPRATTEEEVEEEKSPLPPSTSPTIIGTIKNIDLRLPRRKTNATTFRFVPTIAPPTNRRDGNPACLAPPVERSSTRSASTLTRTAGSR